MLVQLKGNRPRLLARLREHTQRRPARDEHYSTTLGRRNRIEQRRVRVWPLVPGSGHAPWHDHFHCLIEVVRATEIFEPERKSFTPRAEAPALYLCTTLASAEDFAHAIRGHWAIENQLHHVLDTALAEDACRIRCNPGVFAALRHLALNLLRANGETNISQALYRNALCLDRVLGYAGILQK